MKKNISTNEFKNSAIQTVVLTMLSMKVINEPQMSFLYDDKDISKHYLSLLINDAGIKSQLASDHKRYLLVLAYHAFGAGLYVPMQQRILNKPIDQFHDDDVAKILKDLHQIGSLELGLAAVGISLESNNKKVIDHILDSTINSIYNVFSNQIKEDAYIKALLEVYYNAGVTFVMR